MNPISLRPMAEYPQWVPLISEWFYNEWRVLYGKQTRIDIRREIESWLGEGTIPTAFVAVSSDQVIGTVALKEHEEHFIETPWLAGLFVVRDFRGYGIGKLLVQTAEREASSLGVRQLFLYTPEAHEFYLRHGWLVMERRLLPGGPVVLMTKILKAHKVKKPS
jgi:GNAT superfamily N-acetyltransferase